MKLAWCVLAILSLWYSCWRAEGEEGAGGFAVARARYMADVRSKDMHMRMLARAALARTQDVRALRLLAEEYASLESPEERGTLVSLAARCFNRKRDVIVHGWWREKVQPPDDTWLWFRGLVLEHVRNAERVRRTAEAPHSLERRLAAIEAMALRRDTHTLRSLPHLVSKLPSPGQARHLMIGCAASLVFAHRASTNTAEFRTAASALAGLLDDARTSGRSARLIRRYLAATLGEDVLLRSAGEWRDRIAGKTPAVPALSPTDPLPEFFGLQSVGRSVCYLIDMSDSMATRLTGDERRDFQEASGLATPAGKGEGGGPAQGAGLGKTRFDAVREVLKRSLRALPEHTMLVVVGFGTEAEVLGGRRALVPASKANVRSVIRALDRVHVDESGHLRGSTNLHGAMRIAFGLGPPAAGSTATTQSIAPGVETLFVLSDGMPNVDDWGGGGAGSVVKGGAYGSFVAETQLLEDVHRANLLLKAEIHCVGVGPSSRELLRKIARLGLGGMRILGGGEPKYVDTRSDAVAFAEPDPVQALLREIDPRDEVRYRGDDPRARIRVMEELGALGAKEALPRLVYALASLDRDERMSALKVLQSLTQVPMGSNEDLETLDGGVRLRGKWARWLAQHGK